MTTSPAPLGIKIFIDFWNYELSMKGVDPEFRTDWFSIAHPLIDEVESLMTPPHGVMNFGVHVYGSYHPVTETAMNRWATNTLARIPSFSASFTTRQKKKKGAVCPVCHAECEKCPICGESMLGYGEKGVDTRLAIDMVKFAWEDAYDVAVLVSADRDFKPVIELLNAKGKQIIHGAFPPNGMVLTNACWGRIDIPSLREQFRRIG